MKPFRFGVVSAQAPSGQAWLARAQRIEALGFATLLIPDNLRYTFAPLPALAAAAAATSTLRVGTYVLANDLRHPTVLAKDVATLDLLSGGRFELGLGAGRPNAPEDNAMLGLEFERGGVRLARLAESLGIVKRLLSGETVTHSGPYYTLNGANITPAPAQQPRPPILVAGTGPKLLELAGREADIIALGLAPDVTAQTVSDKIDVIRQAAGPRFADIELNLNLMAVGDRVPRYMKAQYGLDGPTLARANAIPAVHGSLDDMCAQLRDRRATLGISYWLVSDELMEDFAPVVQRLHGS